MGAFLYRLDDCTERQSALGLVSETRDRDDEICGKRVPDGKEKTRSMRIQEIKGVGTRTEYLPVHLPFEVGVLEISTQLLVRLPDIFWNIERLFSHPCLAFSWPTLTITGEQGMMTLQRAR